MARRTGYRDELGLHHWLLNSNDRFHAGDDADHVSLMSMTRRHLPTLKDGYYTYFQCFPDGTPYYVGFGKNERYRNCGNKPAKEIRNQILAQGHRVLRVVIEQENKQAARAAEKELIRKYGVRHLGTGILVNIFAGKGSGVQVWTESMREAIRKAQLGRKASPEARAKMSKALLGNKHLLGHIPSAETRAKISQTLRLNKREYSQKERLRRSALRSKRNVQNPPRKGKTNSLEHNRKVSEARKRYFRLKKLGGLDGSDSKGT